jgi:hypothetical protein
LPGRFAQNLVAYLECGHGQYGSES